MWGSIDYDRQLGTPTANEPAGVAMSARKVSIEQLETIAKERAGKLSKSELGNFVVRFFLFYWVEDVVRVYLTHIRDVVWDRLDSPQPFVKLSSSLGYSAWACWV